MKELCLLLKESLTFYRETLGNPDPNYRPPTKTIVVVMFSAAVLIFAYNYGGIALKAITTPKPTYAALEKEAVELRIELGRVQRLKASCAKNRDNLEQAYTDLLSSVSLPLVPYANEPELETPIPADTFYDRL